MRARYKAILTISLFLGMTVGLPHAQQATAAPTDSLRVWQSLWATTGFKYQHGLEQGDVGLGASKVKEIVRDNPRALHEVKVFGRFQVPAFFGTIASAAVLGFGLATDKKELTYAGGGVLALSLVIDQVGYPHLKKAARIYNESK
jgi:hypothetical protein